MVVGIEICFYSNVIVGIDVYFCWRFGDDGSSNIFKGLRIFFGEINYNVGYLFFCLGKFNVLVEVFNVISLLWIWIIVYV